eukprot:CAMPEP_0198137120 /NCGR_PEP_ID=MMETSP1443-20131203/659_1 /TAXON_ID=186043 /ORGANISM="Entomoneis sp., Strain CCMP2396" /LENGTH=141 /DNA_ID=CAMNT_0043798453 /DNA_START=136 /DNA_END=561 /DNA_ORIENTATION=-
MATGVDVDDEIATTFNDFKLNAGPEKLRYIMYKVQGEKIVISGKGPRNHTYEDFCELLEDGVCRYALIDLEFKTTDGRPTSKLVLISWVPEDARVKDKMIYSGSKETLKTALVGVGIHINCTDRAELDFETSIFPQVKKFA